MSSAFGRGLRSVVTALIALSLGVALVSWLKAGSDDARQAGQAGNDPQATSSPRQRSTFWAHRKSGKTSNEAAARRGN